MDRNRILHICSILPDTTSYYRGIRNKVGRRSFIRGEQDRVTAAYSKALFDPAFGWVCVQALLDSHADFLPDLTEKWIYRAYHAYVTDIPDKVVAEAVSFESPSRYHVRALVRSFLLLRDADLKEIARMLRLPVDVLECYEQLFWNVRDRLEDVSYITNLVYPQGRRIEMEPDYLRKETLDMLLMRAIYSGHYPVAAQLAGVMSTHLKLGDSTTSAAELEALIMSNANFFAKLGGLNQDMVPAISHATKQMAAAKAGGQVDQASESRIGLGALNHGDAIVETLSGMGRDAMARQQALEAAQQENKQDN